MRTVLLAGGVGGSRMADGLARVLGPELTVVVNTGDDFEHYGLRICPDLDTVLYTLAGVGNPQQGWGVAGESYACLEMLERYGEEAWFRLGDRDLATHLLRHQRLQAGMRLTEVTAELASRLGVSCRLLPMCDEPVATWLDTELGAMGFQDYFVRHRHQPAVRSVELRGSPSLSPEVRRALSCAELIVLAPSNPFVSLLPILSVPGVREALQAPLVAVSPIVGGEALKGPAAAMLRSLGYPATAGGAVQPLGLSGGLLVVDERDAGTQAPGWEVFACPTVMPDAPAREALARRILGRVARSG